MSTELLRCLWRGSALACLLVAALAGCKQPDGATSQGGAGGGATSGGSAATGGGATAGIGKAAPYTGDTIVLGEFSSLTGGTASFGASTSNGIKMAVNEANKAGGVLGKQIEVRTEDDKGQADEAVTVVKRLISNSNVLAIIGEVASSNSLAAAPICQTAGVPMLSPASTNPEVTRKGDYIFRVCFIDPFQGAVNAQFALKNLKAKTAAVMTDVTSDYSKGLSAFFMEAFTKGGGKIVAEVSYSQGDKNFRTQLTTIKGKNPDVIFIPGYYTEVGNIAVQARSLGIQQPMLGGDGWDSPKLTEIGKSAIEGSYFSTHYSPESRDPRVQSFVATYKKAFNETPDSNAALAYDATRVMLDAIKRAGGTDRAKIRDALAATKGFKGVTGDITLNADRNAVKPAVMLQVKGGQFKYVATVKP